MESRRFRHSVKFFLTQFSVSDSGPVLDSAIWLKYSSNSTILNEKRSIPLLHQPRNPQNLTNLKRSKFLEIVILLKSAISSETSPYHGRIQGFSTLCENSRLPRFSYIIPILNPINKGKGYPIPL